MFGSWKLVKNIFLIILANQYIFLKRTTRVLISNSISTIVGVTSTYDNLSKRIKVEIVEKITDIYKKVKNLKKEMVSELSE